MKEVFLLTDKQAGKTYIVCDAGGGTVVSIAL
jgi:hypothetical protein